MHGVHLSRRCRWECLFVTIDSAAPRLCLASPRIIHRSAPLHLLSLGPCRRGCTAARTRSVFLPCTDNYRLWLEFVDFVSGKLSVGILKAVIYATPDNYILTSKLVPEVIKVMMSHVCPMTPGARTAFVTVAGHRWLRCQCHDSLVAHTQGAAPGRPPSTVWF